MKNLDRLRARRYYKNMPSGNIFLKSGSINQGVRRNSPFLTPYYSKGIIRSKLILAHL